MGKALTTAVLAAWLGGCGAGALATEELHADLDRLFATVGRVHPNPHAYTSKQHFARMRAELYRQARQPKTPAEFYKLLAPALASLRFSHTFVYPPKGPFQVYRELGGGVYPLAIRLAGGEVFVADIVGGSDIPIGGRILRVNGQEAGEFLERMARYFPAEGKDTDPTRLEEPPALRLHLWLVCGGERPLRLRVQGPKGAVAEHLLAPMHSAELERRLEARGPRPILPYSWRMLPEADAALLTIHSFTDSHWYIRFLAGAFRDAARRNVGNLILDLRRNRGGTLRLAEMLLLLLADRPFKLYETILRRGAKGPWVEFPVPESDPGRTPPWFRGGLYVLVGPRTSSVSVAVAAAVKHYRLGTLIGGLTGGPRTVYGGTHRFTLPHSGLQVAVASIRATVVGSGKGDRGVRPHHVVRQTPADAARGVDTVLQFTLDLIRRRQHVRGPSSARAR